MRAAVQGKECGAVAGEECDEGGISQSELTGASWDWQSLDL